jgi:hypothetical protein
MSIEPLARAILPITRTYTESLNVFVRLWVIVPPPCYVVSAVYHVLVVARLWMSYLVARGKAGKRTGFV